MDSIQNHMKSSNLWFCFGRLVGTKQLNNRRSSQLYEKRICRMPYATICKNFLTINKYL